MEIWPQMPVGVLNRSLGSPRHEYPASSIGAETMRFSPYFSLSKNYANTPVSAIIEETGVFSWKAGEKMHGMSQSS